jgi:hypothetical protein
MKHGWMSATAVALIVGCTVSQSVKTAARLGVQDGSAYIRMKLMPSAARRLIFGQPAVDILIFGSPLLAVLRRKDVVLSVVDNFRVGLLRDGSHQNAEPAFA